MRPIITLLLFGLLAGSASARDVYFRGEKISQRHAIYGRVLACGRTTATINLGFAHGVLETSSFLICRYSDEQVTPIASLRIRRVTGSTSSGFLSSIARVRPGDFAVIPAKRLDLWKHGSRLSRVSQMEFVRRQGSNGYDNRDLSSDLYDEIDRDDNLKERALDHRRSTWGSFIIDSVRFRIRAAKKAGKPNPFGTAPAAQSQASSAYKDDGATSSKLVSAKKKDRNVGPFGKAFANLLDRTVFEGESLDLTQEEIDALSPEVQLTLGITGRRQRRVRSVNEERMIDFVRRMFDL